MLPSYRKVDLISAQKNAGYLMKSKCAIWWPFYIGDYRSETIYLNHLEKGLYVDLLSLAWEHGGRIQNSDQLISRALGIPVDEWNRHKHNVLLNFTIEENWITHERQREELIKAEQVSEKRKQAGLKGMSSRYGKSYDND